jgi:lysyl-tRNA synthetase, class I
VHGGAPKLHDLPVNFALLLNLVSVANTDSEEILWSFISQYAPGVSAATHPELAKLVGFALRYYADRVAPTLQRRAPTAQERAAMQDLRHKLDTLPHDADALQTEVYEVGKRHGFEPLRSWFAALYECLFGHSAGPRMGTFMALYGVENSKRLLDEALAR